MSQINNDNEFKNTLMQLSTEQQRIVGALFVENVLSLCDDKRIRSALTVARTPGPDPEELANVYKSAKTTSTETFTQCGKDADWLGQASHFVAAAAAACVTPKAQLKQGDNLAWVAAMHARMARTFSTIAGGEGSENTETQTQYHILADYLKSIASSQ